MSDFSDVPVLGRGTLRVKWGLHWVWRIVEVRTSGLLNINTASPKQNVEVKELDAWHDGRNQEEIEKISQDENKKNFGMLSTPTPSSTQSSTNVLDNVVKEIGFLRNLRTPFPS